MEYNPPLTNLLLSKEKIGVSNEIRKIELPTYKSKRPERLSQNKPVYSYQPTILKQWSLKDFKKNKLCSFNFDPDKESNTSYKNAQHKSPMLRQVFVSYNVDRLRMFVKPHHRSDRWFIVADTKALLSDLAFINSLLTHGYPECRLKLPYEVLHDLSAMTARHNKLWMKMPARRLANYIHKNADGPKKHIIGQSPLEAEDLIDIPESLDSVINCCLQMTKLYYYVVLITDEADRRTRALSVKIPCFTLEHAKKSVVRGSGDIETNFKVTVATNSPSTATAQLH